MTGINNNNNNPLNNYPQVRMGKKGGNSGNQPTTPASAEPQLDIPAQFTDTHPDVLFGHMANQAKLNFGAISDPAAQERIDGFIKGFEAQVDPLQFAVHQQAFVAEAKTLGISPQTANRLHQDYVLKGLKA